MVKLPKITEAQIRALASAQSFERGKSYYQGGAIIEPLRQGLELRAECEGSEYEPYQISVALNPKGIGETSCTCPYDWGGICKHIVALLLTYAHNPQAFRHIEPLDKMLAGKSRDDLIVIIQDMLRHQPNLISVVELTKETQEIKPGQPMNVSVYRTQARRALQHESSRSVERESDTPAKGGGLVNVTTSKVVGLNYVDLSTVNAFSLATKSGLRRRPLLARGCRL